MTHTPACRAARAGLEPIGPQDVTPDWPLMYRLTVEDQQAVLDCPHPAHDSVRFYLRRPWRPAWVEVR